MRRPLTLAVLLACGPAWAVDVTIKGSAYTLDTHPRLLLDGPAGTITARIKDPDGVGAGVAPQATDANPAFVALKALIRSCRASPDYCSGNYERPTTVLALAMDWYMDNSQTDSKTAAIYWLNNIETWISNGYEFGCDIGHSTCGLSSWTDWPSWDLAIVAQAYSIMRSEMSAGERTTLTQKIFNDDSVYYQDGCTNQLQVEATATATYTSGSMAVTGTNLSGLTAGRKIEIRSGATVGWATIQTVNSATSLTLTGAPQGPLGGNAASITSGTVLELKPWTSATCGLTWLMQHHSYTPQGLINGFVTLNTALPAYDADDTTITTASTASLPAAPFFIIVPGTGEIMKVTAKGATSLTVDRAQMGTTAAAAQYPPRAINYSRYIPIYGGTDYANNLTVQKVAGFLTAGLAFADDSALAQTYTTWAADLYIDSVIPRLKDMWTGFQQSGSSNYGPGRQLTENLFMVLMLKNVDAALDKTSGNWLSGLTDLYLYTNLPNAATQFIGWGQADLAIANPTYHTHMWAPIQTCLAGESSNQAKYWNYWQRSVSGEYTSGNLTAGSNERLIPFALMCWQESDTSTDYRAVLGTQRAFNVSDGTAGRALDGFVSRTGWSSASDTVVFAQSFGLWWGVDHIGSGAPGAYKLFKGGYTLSENGAYDTGVGLDTNMIRFGSAANLNTTSSLSATIDRATSGTGWAFARVDAQGAYTTATAVTRALRQLIHFKKSAAPDYLVVYDSAATSAAKAIGQNLHYDKTAGQSPSITDTLPNIVWTGPDRRVSTKIVLPSGLGVARTATSLTNSFREYVCASSDGATCANATSAEFLIVHKPSTSTSDTLPTTNALATIDSDFSGVEIADASAPSVAVFAKTTDQNAGSFTTTLGGTAQIIVSGLVAGTYDVTKDAGAYLTSQSVDTNGVLAFTGTAAAYAISQTGTATAPTITTTTLANGVLGQAYSATLAASDGALPLTWDVSAGTICTGLTLSSAGVISGTPSAIQTCNFTARVTDNLAQTDTQALSITIQTPPPSLTMSAQPGSTSVVVGFSTPGLAYDQPCDVSVSQTSTTECQPNETSCVVQRGTATSATGGASRRATVTGLATSAPGTASVTCGTAASGTVSFTTSAATSGVNQTFNIRAPAWVKARATAQYGSTANLGLVVCFDATCATTYSCKMLSDCPGDLCTVTRSLTAGIWPVWHRWSILPAGADVCAESPTYATTTHRKGYIAIP